MVVRAGGGGSVPWALSTAITNAGTIMVGPCWPAAGKERERELCVCTASLFCYAAAVISMSEKPVTCYENQVCAQVAKSFVFI